MRMGRSVVALVLLVLVLALAREAFQVRGFDQAPMLLVVGRRRRVQEHLGLEHLA